MPEVLPVYYFAGYEYVNKGRINALVIPVSMHQKRNLQPRTALDNTFSISTLLKKR